MFVNKGFTSRQAKQGLDGMSLALKPLTQQAKGLQHTDPILKKST